MQVKAFCPNADCGASYSISSAEVGRTGVCRKCGTSFEMGRDTWADDRGRPVLLSEPDEPDSLTPGRVAGALGSQFGRYKIISKLGQGGMGAVYLAYDDKLERPVALKMPHFDIGSNPEVVGRFLREARAAAAFHHPNFCPIYDFGEIEGTHYLAMAYIEGQTLNTRVERDRPMAPRQAAETARQLALALAEAHRRGIVHRDLKPSNVMIDARGTLIIMDFGVARRTGAGDADWTQPGALLGTPYYMSPEQVRGDKQATGPATDIYALGVILYQLLTGRRPFEGPVSVVLGLITVQEPPPPREHRPGIDRELDAICRKAMAKKIEDRYPSMEALAAALEAYLARPEVPETPETPATAPPAAAPARERSPSRLAPVLVTSLVLLGLVAAAGFFLVQKGIIRVGADGPPVQVATNGPTAPPADGLVKTPDVPAQPPVVPIAKDDTPPPPPEPAKDEAQQPPSVKVETPPPPTPPAPPTPEPAQQPPPRDDRQDALAAFARGSELLAKRAYVGAIAEFDRAIRLDPTNADAFHKRGVIHEARGDHERAIVDASEAIRIKPDHADALDNRGRAWIGKKEFDKALADLNRAIAIDPRHADAHDNRGRVWFALKDYDKAIADFRQATRLEDDHPHAFMNLGLAYQAKGDHERAASAFTDALDDLEAPGVAEPDDSRKAAAHNHRGRSRVELKQFDKALADLDEAIHLDPKLPDAYDNRGRAWFALKDYDKAIADFRMAVRLEEDHPHADMNLGLAYQAKGDHERAVAAFTEAIDDDPNRADAYLERAESRAALVDYARSIEDCDAALRINPRLADAYDLRGVAHYVRREYDAAIVDFTAATRLDSKHPNAFEGRGKAWLVKGDFARAIADLETALRIEPDDAPAAATLASILASCPDDGLRDGRRALDLASMACEVLRFRDAFALNALAEAHAELGQFDEAVRRQAEVIELLKDERSRQGGRDRLALYQQGRPYRAPRR